MRYLAADIATPTFFRTDRGDDEGAKEWARDRVAGCVDGRGDDDVDVILPSSGAVQVAYRKPPVLLAAMGHMSSSGMPYGADSVKRMVLR